MRKTTCLLAIILTLHTPLLCGSSRSTRPSKIKHESQELVVQESKEKKSAHTKSLASIEKATLALQPNNAVSRLPEIDEQGPDASRAAIKRSRAATACALGALLCIGIVVAITATNGANTSS